MPNTIYFIVNLLMLPCCFYAGMLVGSKLKNLGFTGIKFFFEAPSSIMMMTLLFFLLTLFLLSLTGPLFPIGIICLVVGFLKGIRSYKIGEDMSSIHDFEIFKTKEDVNPIDFGSRKKVVKKRTKQPEDEVPWPDIKDL